MNKEELLMIPNSDNHPWAVYLEARAKAIEWMATKMYCTDKMILERLKIDEDQIRMIREYMQEKNKDTLNEVV